MKKVDIYMATLWRQGHAVISIKSLISQPEFGTGTIICNNWTDEQWEWINGELNSYDNIILYRGDNKKGSNEKIKYINIGHNYYICLADDDLIYPNDYLNKLINGCEKYNAHVSLHGRTIPKGIISSYYKQIGSYYRALGSVEHDVEVDITSNCGSLFKRNFYDDLDEWYNFCSTTSMDDIYVNYFAKKKGIRRMVLSHKEGYLKHKKQLIEDDYVFSKYKNNDKVQTDFINNYFNKI